MTEGIPRDSSKLAGSRRPVAATSGCAGAPSKARVVVVGGGFGGATAAKYLRLWDPAIEVVLVERAEHLHLLPDLQPGARRASRAWRTSATATTACAATACRWCTTRPRRSTRRRKLVRLARGGDICLRPPGRVAGHRFHCSARSRATRRRCKPAACCTPGKPAPQTVALRRQLEADARRRRLRPFDPARALPLPAGALRAREPGGGLLQAGQAALQGAGAGRQSGRDLQGGRCSRPPGRISTRASSSTAATPRRSASTRATHDGEARSRGRQGRRAERRAAAPRRRHRARRPD